MIARLRRQINTPISCIGDWFINNTPTKLLSLEDNDKGLAQGMTLEEIKKKKVQNVTAIPTGHYEAELYKSPRFTKQYGRDMWMIHLKDVKGYEGILVHPLNTPDQTEGCLGVGKTKAKNFIGNSRPAYKELMNYFAPVLGFTITMQGTMPILNPIQGFKQKEKLFIHIERNY